MRVLGLIGYPLGHSFSAGYFSRKFEAENIKNIVYNNYSIANIEELPTLIHSIEGLVGLNVTIPYKQQVIPFLHELSADAKKIGAVNTIKIEKVNNDFYLKGYNTDAFGFLNTLEPLLESHHKKALILGSGGASKAVEFVLEKLGIEYLLVSREPKKTNQISYQQVSEEMLSDYHVIINTSPLGMYPNVDSMPLLPYHAIGSKHILYDLVYNPLETRFLHMGKLQEATIINGLQMLHLQADRAWAIWNNVADF
jgi:shikimate dehydrogenase